LVRYTAVDDVGRAINPMVVDGQTHGGAAQGIGQALWECCTYDAHGQLLSASFMDYAMPRADLLPSFTTDISEVLSPTNRLGVRGAGEGGTTGALGDVVNAVVDALAEFGVTHIEMPVTPERIWQDIQSSKACAASSTHARPSDPAGRSDPAHHLEPAGARQRGVRRHGGGTDRHH